MKNIPQWLEASLRSSKLKCHKCKKIFKVNQLKAVGIRDSYQKAGMETLFIELVCSNCSEMTLYEIKEMSLIEFSYEIADDFEMTAEDMAKKEKSMDIKEEIENIIDEGPYVKKKRKKSKITLKELKDSVKFLNNCENNEEFLIAIGMTPEEIDKYNIKKKNTKTKKTKKKNDK